MTIILRNISPPSLRDRRAPAEAYRSLASLIVFLPSPLTLQRWSPKYPRWKQHLACVLLCAFFFLLFSFFFVSGLTACFDRGEREYCPGGTSFSHSIVDDRFVLCFRAQPIAVGFRRQYDKPCLSVPHRGTRTGAQLAKNMSHLLLPCLPP